MSKRKVRFLHEYFTQYCDQVPSQPAIVHHHQEVTYGQLNRYAEQLSRQLHSYGLAKGDRVLLEFDPCPQAITLMVCCSMLGVVFIPISPELPQGRVEEIADISQAQMHIQSASSEKREFSNAVSFGLATVSPNIDEGITLIRPPKARNQNAYGSSYVKLIETDLAYIIFTSGTTGKPKGIMMSHHAVVSFFDGMQAACNVKSGSRIGTTSPIQFDFSILDMGLAFGSGSTLVQVPRTLLHHPARWLNYVKEKQIEQMNGVPSIWQPFIRWAKERDQVQDFPLKAILYAGEHFQPKDLWRLKQLIPSLNSIINCFGQSESVACTFKEIYELVSDKTEAVPIGNGQDNVEMILINKNGERVEAVNEVGEIYLRGPILFSGYWRNSELTMRTLVPNPLFPDHGEKVFRTGDLAYKGEDGELYYIGRKDMQVKINGYRVEVSELESRISEHPDVLQAAVTAVEFEDKTVLWAAIVTSDARVDLTIQKIRTYCASTLPAYMLPEKLFRFRELPITSNGKINYKEIKQRMLELNKVNNEKLARI